MTSHVRALLAADGFAASVAANLADPAAVLADPAFRAVIDTAKPIGLIFGFVLSLMPAPQARQVVAGTPAWSPRAATWSSRAPGATTRDSARGLSLG